MTRRIVDLTESDKERMVSLRKKGHTLIEIASLMDMNLGSVSKLLKGVKNDQRLKANRE